MPASVAGKALVVIVGGVYGVIGKAKEFETKFGGLTTVTWAAPEELMSLAEMGAVNCVLLTNAVVLAEPFQFTVKPDKKFNPFTVSVKAGPVATALEGEREVIVGPVVVKVRAFEVPPPGAGFETVTCAEPVLAISVEGIAAVTFVPLTKVVVRLLPFQCACKPEIKPAPVSVNVKSGPPAAVLEGDRETRVGTGLEDGGGGVPPPPPQLANAKTIASARVHTATPASGAMRSRRVPS